MISIIAEIGINHNGNIDNAFKLIDIAKVAGCDYVKFQKRTPELCVPEHKKSEPKLTPWGNTTYLGYKEQIEFGIDEYEQIDQYCHDKKIGWFASVWDIKSAEFMKSFTDIVKIPSALINNFELLSYCRENFKTVIISTGMSTETEIEKAIKISEPTVIMHTNSSYPSKVDELNLNYIKWLKERYPLQQIGYSGHEFGLTTTFATVSLGAKWIERHVTLDHEMWGSDQKASVDPVGLFKLVRGIRDIEKAMTGYCPRDVFESEKSKRNDLRK